jgi:tetratricopeptide (TPR) repeat protein
MNLVFEREGEYWSVGQGPVTSRLRDSKGLRYIDLLLRKPEVEFHALDLVTAVEGSSPEPRIQQRRSMQGTDIDALDVGAEDAGELLDPEARRAYKERLKDLRSEIEEAESFNDPERVASATEEADFLSRELAAAVGLRGATRKASSTAERARVNVTRAIKSALDRITENDEPLGRYLSATIKTGTFCSYTPLAPEDTLPAAAPPSRGPSEDRIPLPPLGSQHERHTFVGRAPELARLDKAWDRAQSSGREFVSIAGEPGIGKTRLAWQFARTAYERGAVVLYGRSDEETLLPYQPFVEALTHYAAHTSVARLEQQVERAGAELLRLLPDLSRVLPKLPESARAEPETERYRLFEAVGSLFAQIGAERPVVMLMDDLQWIDRGAALLLRHLLRSGAERLRLLVVGTYRTTELDETGTFADLMSSLGRETDLGRIALEGLPEGEVSELITDLTGHEPPRSLALALQTATAGNPFFIGEVSRSLPAVEDGDGFAANGAVALSDLEIPEGVKDAVTLRLAKLGDDATTILRLASVVGAEFPIDLLARLAGREEDDLLDVLDAAVGAHLIAEVPAQVGRYRFAHALVRESLYEGITGTRRARIHHRIADSLRTLRQHDLQPYLSELAHHYVRAGQPALEQALEYSIRAGRNSNEQLAYEEAARHYDEALAAHPQADGDPRRRCELLLELGEAHSRASHFDQARRAFRAVRDIASALDAPQLVARAALEPGGPLMQTAFIDDDLVQRLEEALVVLPDTEPRLRARLLSRLAVELREGPVAEQRERLSSEALAIAQSLGDSQVLAEAMLGRHYALLATERVEDRLAIADATVRLGEDNGDPIVTLQGQIRRFSDLLELGQLTAARDQLRDCARVASDARQPVFVFSLHIMTGSLELLAGRHAEVERHLAEAAALGEGLGSRDMVQGGMGPLGAGLLQARGQWTALAAALEPVVDQGNGVPGWRAGLAHAYCELGRLADAREHFERLAVDDFEGVSDGNRLLALAELSLVCAALEDTERAAQLHTLLEPHREHCVLGHYTNLLLGPVALYLGVLARTMRRHEPACEHFELALSLSESMESPPWKAQTQYEYAQLLLAGGAPTDRERARELLDQAAAIATQIGMNDLDRRISVLR